MLKLACVAVVRNEERHIAEWVAYQFALGFDKVLLLDNLSTDTTKAAALPLARQHDLEILDWPVTKADYQTIGYQFAIMHLENQFDWVAFFDTDEFLVLDDGLNLKTCLAARQDAAAVAVSWAMFGSSGHRVAPVGPVVENFVHRSPASFGPNAHVKSIIRPQAMISCPNAHVFDMNGRTTDLAGRDVQWQMLGVQAGPPDYKIGKLHHYFTRSLQEWVEKLRRGYPGQLRRKLSDFRIYDRNDVFDDTAARFARRSRGGAAQTST